MKSIENSKKYKKRVGYEKETVRIMIEMYCNLNHGTKKGDLCKNCSELLNYALKRIELCPLHPHKPTCDSCIVHCYEKQKREEIRKVMRFSGPKMTFYHPIKAIRHLFHKIIYKPKPK